MNAVLVKGDAVGATLYYGAGAGAEPTASAVIADLVDVTRMHTADPEHRVPHLAFQPDQLTDTSRAQLDEIEAMLDFFGERFGPYPFSSSGAIVDVTDAGYQMETQTRPEFTSAAGLRALAHELVHQWFGDDVAVRRMRDVWLSEGFATYGAWLWTEHTC